VSEHIEEQKVPVQEQDCSKGKIAALVALALALLILVGGLRLLLPFFEPICWAIILALFFYPLYERLKDLLYGSPALASFVMCILIVTFIIIPVFALITSLTTEVLKVYASSVTHIQSGDFTLLPDAEKFPMLHKLGVQTLKAFKFYGADIRTTLMEVASNLGEFFLKQGTIVFKNVAAIIFKAALMVVILFYLFTDGVDMLFSFKKLLPLRTSTVDRFMKLTSDVLSATLYGNILTGAIQAGLGIFIFWLLNFSAPLLWGIILGLGTFIPMIGTAIVWAPASLYLFLSGAYLEGAILLAFSLLVISQIDYFLRPYLISGKTELHNLFLFLGIIGGINVFGLLGLILGPMVIALCMSILELYRLNLREREESWKKDLLI